ncbi:transketolase, partial [bacterium]|nr:transketolase [candidate division CSSED10-310 bacterium]
PSWELFDAQPEYYRESVLPAKVTRRLAVEAGSSLGWAKYVGPRGAVIAMDRFGASAPGRVLEEKFGFTVENVVTTALELLRQ